MKMFTQRYLWIYFAFVALSFPLYGATGSGAVSSNDLTMTYSVTPPSSSDYTLTLITGDRLFLTRKKKDSSYAITVLPKKRNGGAVLFNWYKDERRGLMIVPMDVRHLIPHQLDPSFFYIDQLIESGMDDARMPFIPVLLKGADAAAICSDAGLTIRALPFSRYSSSVLTKTCLRGERFQFRNYFQSAQEPERHAEMNLRLDRMFRINLDKSVPTIGGDLVHQDLGLHGKGINIAILDSGVDSTHPDFYFENGLSKIGIAYDLTCFSTNDPALCDNTVEDLHGHGTHVAGIALGTGLKSAGHYKGIAPLSTLLNIKVLNQRGKGLESSIIEGLKRAILGSNEVRGDEPDIEADVISLSFGLSWPLESEGPLESVINHVVDMYDIPIVIAAGNQGPGYFAIDSPALAEKAITIGASSKNAPVGLAPFSGRGPTAFDFRLKPDLLAPGLEMTSTCSLNGSHVKCKPDNPYNNDSGTSMAAPLAAGAIALMVEQAEKRGESLSVETMKNRLMSTAKGLIPQSTEDRQKINVYTEGAGLLKIDRALQSDIYLSPSRISFSAVPLNTKVLERKIMLVNRGKRPKQVIFSTMLKDVATASHSNIGGNSYHDLMTVSPKTVMVEPGTPVPVTIRINVEALPSPMTFQAYEGKVIARERGSRRTVHSILGFIHQGPLFPVEIKGLNQDGTPARYALVTFYDALNADGFDNSAFGSVLDENGTVRLDIPKGVYNITLTIFDDLTGKRHYYRVTEYERTIDENSGAVLLDASLAEPVVLDLSIDPKADLCLHEGCDISYVRPDHSYRKSGWFMLGGCLDNLWVYGSHRPEKGQLTLVYRWLISQSPLLDSKATYDWVKVIQKDIPFQETVDANRLKSLGKNISRYYSHDSHIAGYGRFSCVMVLDKPECSFLTGIYPMQTPSVREEYFIPEIAVYQSYYWPNVHLGFLFESSEISQLKGHDIYGKRFAPYEIRNESWAKRLFTPAITFAERKKNALRIFGYTLTDAFGHGGSGSKNDITFDGTFYVNQKPVKRIEDFNSVTTLRVPARESLVGIKLNTLINRPWVALPIEVESMQTFQTSSKNAGDINVLGSSYSVEGMGTDNRVHCDGNLEMDISLIGSVDPYFKIIDSQVSLSVDSGKTWFKVEHLEEEEKKLEVETFVPIKPLIPTSVSTKLDVKTTHGITFTEKIIDAFFIETK